VRIVSGIVLAAFGLLLVTGALTEVTRRCRRCGCSTCEGVPCRLR